MSRRRFAFLFPGQGAQYVGMGKDFFDTFKVAKETFQEADDLLGYHLSKLIFEGPETRLVETNHSQPAIFVVSCAILRTLQQQFPDLLPAVCSGLSLGEYTALYATDCLSFRETLSLIERRAFFMSEACKRVDGGMAAVLGLDAVSLEEALKGKTDLWIANYNGPGQIVISGTKEAIEKSVVELKAKGAKRVIPLQVAGPFHSPLMQSAQDLLTPFILEVPLQESAIEYVMNVPGKRANSLKEVRENLIVQVTHSVRWEQGILGMQEVDQFIEIGCGKTLAGINRKIGVSQETLSIEKVADLDLIAQRGCV